MERSVSRARVAQPSPRETGVLLGRRFDQPFGRRALLAGSAAALAAPFAGGAVARAAQDASPVPTTGGRVVIGLIQEPGQLNDFFNGQSGSFLSVLAVEPLFVPDIDGVYQPVLAAEAPTLENGGVSEDFLTVTYKLRDGITWSDGEPFTAEDIAFTFEVYQNPESTPNVGSAYEAIESVTVVDPLTAEVRMTEVNPGYLDLWQNVQPRHRFESSAVTLEHPLARIPLGTGPFVIADWQTGAEILLERNPNYREEGKPYLDGITVRVTPEKEAAIASFVAGDLDYLFFVVTGDLPTLTEAEEAGEGVNVELRPGGAAVEWLWLNLGTEGDPNTPHPVLGDPAVREAMDLAIDRQAIIDQILGGFGSLTGSLIFSGWAAVDVPAAPYDPARAMEVLDAAGWVPGGDGVREKEGVRASLRYQTIAGDQTRELYQQLVQQNMRDVGIELTIENVPSNTLFGSYEEGGVLARGDYDIVMSRDGYEVDPVQWVALFTTASIPSAEAPNEFTYSFYSNPEYDRIAEEAASTLDQEARRELYAQLVEIFAADRPALPLYRSASADAWRERLQGARSAWFDPRGTLYSAADWFVEE
jgi:peptide/nickel transport system substrate-binding protein